MPYAYSTRNGCSKFIIFCLLCSDSSDRGNNNIRPLQQYYTAWYITYVSPVTEGRPRIRCRFKDGIARGNEIIIKKNVCPASTHVAYVTLWPRLGRSGSQIMRNTL